MAQSRILDQYGHPIELKTLTQEVVRPTLAGIRSVWSNPVIAPTLTPDRLASILIEADQNSPRAYLTLAEEMEEREPHYASVLGTRKRAVSGVPVAVEAASEDRADEKIADAVRELTRAPQFEDMLESCLDALGKGYSAVEILWDRSGNAWRPADYVWRDQRFFVFDRLTMRELRLLDTENIDGVRLPPAKFITHLPRLKCGLPVRGGLARLAAALYMAKSYTLTDWLAFAEIFGLPLRIGKYGPNAKTEDIDTLITAVSNIGTDAAAVIPESMQIDFQDAQGSDGGDHLFLALADWLDRQVSKAVLGQTLSTDAQSTGLGASTAEVHNDVREDIQRADSRQLANTLNSDLVRPYVDLNFGPQKSYPRIHFPIAEPEDTEALSKTLERLVPLGLRISAKEVRDKLSLRAPEKGEEILGAPAVPETSANALACNAANHTSMPNIPSQDDIDHLAEQAASDWEPVMEPMIADIERVANEVAEGGGGQTEFRARLAALFNHLDEAELAERIGTATLKAFALGDATDNPVA